MATTRDFNIPAAFAELADTDLNNPVAGQSYRDDTIGELTFQNGVPYLEPYNSAKQNQMFYTYTRLLEIVDKQGIVGWGDLVDYAVPAIVYGSDNALYTALQASGPNSGGAQDPLVAPLYWSTFSSGEDLKAELALDTGAGLIGTLSSVPLQTVIANEQATCTWTGSANNLPGQVPSQILNRVGITSVISGTTGIIVNEGSWDVVFAHTYQTVPLISASVIGAIVNDVAAVSQETLGITVLFPTTTGCSILINCNNTNPVPFARSLAGFNIRVTGTPV